MITWYLTAPSPPTCRDDAGGSDGIERAVGGAARAGAPRSTQLRHSVVPAGELPGVGPPLPPHRATLRPLRARARAVQRAVEQRQVLVGRETRRAPRAHLGRRRKISGVARDVLQPGDGLSEAESHCMSSARPLALSR